MLMDYAGQVHVNIDGIAASAASVIAMAGTTVNMAPTALMMIHNPFTIAMGDTDEMERAYLYAYPRSRNPLSMPMN
jgi:ATP-dependent Clp protease protease subunit